MKNNPWTIERAIEQVTDILDKLFPSVAVTIVKTRYTSGITLRRPGFPTILISKDNTTHQLTDKVNEAVSEYCAKNSNKPR